LAFFSIHLSYDKQYTDTIYQETETGPFIPI